MVRPLRLTHGKLRVSPREFFDESIEAIYSSASGHLAPDGGHFACGICCVCAAARVGVAAGGLSDDSGADVLSGGEPGGDGFVGNGSAGAAVWADTGTEPDDIDEFGRREHDYAAAVAGGRPGGHGDRAKNLAAFGRGVGVDQRRAEAGGTDSGESDGTGEL